MTLTPITITWDTTDPEPLAAWWAEQTGARVTATNDGWFVVVQGGNLPLQLAFQKVPDPTPGKNRLHLDFTASDVDAEVDRLVAAGASIVGHRNAGDFQWVTLADPQGNEFCVAPAHEPAEAYDTA
jgi:predicted enzyme related to lactoylglutathione lyase